MSKRLFVGNLCPTTTKATLATAFQQDGRVVENVDLVMTRELGRSRGFAFVEFATEADGEAARAAMHGTSVDGSTLRVEPAVARKSAFGGFRPGGRR